MLHFFRKHQRIVFIFVTVVIVISFSFFGTYGAMSSQGLVEKDVAIAKAIDGSSITQRQVAMMSYFLSSCVEDTKMEERNRPVNLLNDGVLENDVLLSGLGTLLFKQYQKELNEELKERMQKVSSYKPYVHPQAPFISAETVWGHFAPSLPSTIASLKEMKQEVSPEAFSLLSQAYLQQKKIPSSLLKRILLYQQNQASWLEHDDGLSYTDLSVFGFQTVEDWFGSKFMACVSQFVINASHIAKERGYVVTKKQAKESLMENMEKALLEHTSKDKISASEIHQAFYQQIKALGMDETSCVALWQQVLLFRKLFQEAGSSMMIDPLVTQEFHSFANEKAEIEMYELPPSLQLHSFRSMLKFQTYLDAVSGTKRGASMLSFPLEYASTFEIEKKTPELIYKKYSLEIAEIKKEDLLMQTSLKEVWQWEQEEANWGLIKTEFPSLAKTRAETKQQRFEALEKLDAKMRMSVDHFARVKMMEKHPDAIFQALKASPKRTIDVTLCARGGKSPFQGLLDQITLMSHLDKAALQNEKNPSVESIVAGQNLSCYSEDSEHFYSIRVLSRDYSKQVQSYVEADRNGTLDRLLDKKLEEAYVDIRKKDPLSFEQKEGSYKPYAEVKDLVGYYAYPELMRAIEQEYVRATGDPLPSDLKKSLQFYATYRLLPYMNEALAHLKQNASDGRYIKGGETKGLLSDLQKQWLLTKQTKVAARSEKDVFGQEANFFLLAGNWSNVVAEKSGALHFFEMKQKKEASHASFDDVQRVQHMLSMEVQRQLMTEMIRSIAAAKAIDLSPMPSGQEP